MPSTVVELAARKFALPSECPCCGASPDAEVRIPSANTGHALDFPYCKRCLAHAERWDASGVPSAGVMVIVILAAIVLALTTMIVIGLGVFVAGATFAWWLRSARRKAAKAACGASCASAGLALAYLGWTGTTTTFSFASPTFAARFAEANPSLLANPTPQLRKLIDGYRKARLAVPTPAAATGVVPPPLTATEWLARIETTTGVVARRTALSRALEMVEDPQPRRELIQTAARIELAPLVDALQRETSPAAKRNLIEKAIEQVRSDNIQDELEDAVLDKLRARLAELR